LKLKFCAAILNFAFVGLNVFYAISHNNPASYIAAAICFGMGLFVLLND